MAKAYENLPQINKLGDYVYSNYKKYNFYCNLLAHVPLTGIHLTLKGLGSYIIMVFLGLANMILKETFLRMENISFRSTKVASVKSGPRSPANKR
jgi:hypothetical protein